MNPKKVVTRFAPSPTGFMHVGGVRTALFAWAFARKHGGTFILRIEDTDKEREVAGSIEHIQESLRWLNIMWDEGPDIGGPHAPYIQSERLASYKKYADILVAKGLAYADPYTEEDIATFRAKAEEEKRPFLMRDHRPENPPAWDGSTPLRFRVPTIKRYEWHDLVRGDLSAGEEALDDFILIKSDGYPTYNFAHIIDDLEMEVTHIIRGEEFISSTPKFLSLYDALEIPWPQFATMPVILGPGGTKKLSKRDGAKDILDYRTEGYLPEAFINFLAFLGWNPGDEREVMSITDIVKEFDLARVQKGGASFDETKLLWFNAEHMKQLSPEDFTLRLTTYLKEKGEVVPTYLGTIAPALRDRSTTFAEAALHLTHEFAYVEQAVPYNTELLLRNAKAEGSVVYTHLTRAIELLSPLESSVWNADTVKEAVFPYATEVGRGSVLWPMRVALSGLEKSPDPFAIASHIGKEETLLRLSKALDMLQ